VELRFSTEPPQRPVRVHWIHTEAGFPIPANQKKTLCTRCDVGAPGQVLAFRDHAHRLGRQVWSDVLRDGIKVGEVGRRSAQDAQIYRLVAPPDGTALHTGDRVVLHCAYDGSGVGHPTPFGADERTAEMCNQYLMVDEAMQLRCNMPSSHGVKDGDCDPREAKEYKASPAWPLHGPGPTGRCPGPYCKVGQVSGVDVDQETGQVYMFHRSGRNFWNTALINDPTIMRISPEGHLEEQWGAGLFVTPHSITVDRGGGSHRRRATPGHTPAVDPTDGLTVWLTDTSLHQVFQLELPSGEVRRQLGEKGVPGSGPQHFNKPTDVAIASDGSLYISDGYGNSRVVLFRRGLSAAGAVEYTYELEFGHFGSGSAQFANPHGVTLDSTDRAYVADRNNGRIQVFSPSGQLEAVWEPEIKALQSTSGKPWMGFVCALDYDPVLGVIFALVGDTVTMYDLRGRVVQHWGTAGNGDGQFNFPHAIAVGGRMENGHRVESMVYTAELDSQRLQQFIAV